MKNKLLAAITLTVIGSSAMAQSAFQGFYGQISTGYESNSASGLNSPLSLTDGVQSVTLGSTNASNQNFGGMPLIAGLGYNFSITPKWLIGIGADYSFLTQESSSYATNFAIYNQNGVLNGSKIKVSNRFNIFITPGYEIDKDKLVYLKAGYSSIKVDSSAPSSVVNSDYAAPLPGGAGQSKTLNGYVLGVGYKQIISGGFYGFAEGNYMSYAKQNFTTTIPQGSTSVVTNPNAGLSSYQFLVGVGYKF